MGTRTWGTALSRRWQQGEPARHASAYRQTFKKTWLWAGLASGMFLVFFLFLFFSVFYLFATVLNSKLKSNQCQIFCELAGLTKHHINGCGYR
uniref:Uncharacterized protein n=1 Tax=Triticum urartu TaxID=4572 RepID=A0A8R7JZC4_TRIUA